MDEPLGGRRRRPTLLWSLALGATAVEMALYLTLTRPRLLSWGSTKEERVRPLPGDELSDGGDHATQAVTIAAPPEAIWPWLVQMGQGRGGFYTHTWVENLTGARIRNAETIVAEWQALREGDLIRTYWDLPLILPLAHHVKTLVGQRTLVLDWRGEGNGGWTFFLEPVSSGQTRLLLRDHRRRVTTWLLPFHLFVAEPLHLYQQLGMLQGIKERAERV
jgi:hypothetical protein